MNYYPTSIRNLIRQIAKLPGIGKKSAERLTYHVLRTPAPEALALAARLAARHGVAPTLLERDLRRREALPCGPWAAVLLFRYLERSLLARLDAVLQRGAVVILRTFRHAPGYVGNPQPRHRLALPGGLAHGRTRSWDGSPDRGRVR